MIGGRKEEVWKWRGEGGEKVERRRRKGKTGGGEEYDRNRRKIIGKEIKGREIDRKC